MWHSGNGVVAKADHRRGMDPIRQIRVQIIAGFEGFSVQHGKLGNIRVPFQQGRGSPCKVMGLPEEPPDRVDHSTIVCIYQMSSTVSVPRQVKLNDALVWHRLDVFNRIEVVVDAGDVNVIKVKQQSTISLASHVADKLPLR